MSDKDFTEVNEAQIAVHWQEEEMFKPSKEFIAQANMTDADIYKRCGLDNFPECFEEYANFLTWDQPWAPVLHHL